MTLGRRCSFAFGGKYDINDINDDIAIMKTTNVRNAILLGLTVLALAWFYSFLNSGDPPCIFRYRMTATVNTPNGMRTGSSVLEISYASGGDYGGGPSSVIGVKGDAVYVDVGEGKNLFVLLTDNVSGRKSRQSEADRNYSRAKFGTTDVAGLPVKVWEIMWNLGSDNQLCADLKSHEVGKAYDVPNYLIPTMATFTDLQDPNSVKIVQPDALHLNFGTGYSLGSVVIAADNSPTTRILEGVLPWWNARKPSWIHRSMGITDPTIDQLGYSSFRGFQRSDE